MVSPPPGAGQAMILLLMHRPAPAPPPVPVTAPTPRRAPAPPPVLRDVEESDMRGSITWLQASGTLVGLHVLVVDHNGSHMGKISCHEAFPGSCGRILHTVMFTSGSNAIECQDCSWDEVMGHHCLYLGSRIGQTTCADAPSLRPPLTLPPRVTHLVPPVGEPRPSVLPLAASFVDWPFCVSIGSSSIERRAL